MGKANPRRRNNGGKPRSHRADAAVVEQEVADVVLSNTAATTAAGVPPCVRQLRESQEYAVLEEACGDVAYFGLQARHNAALLAEGVPQRIAELLLAAPFDPQHPQDAAGVQGTNGSAEAALVPHKGILYMQIAAAEALRSLVANSEQDRVIDALVSTAAVGATGADFASGLAHLAHADWMRVQQARRSMTPADWMEVYRAETEDAEDAADGAAAAADDEDDNGGAGRAAAAGRRAGAHSSGSRNVYFTLLRHLDEVLSLATVCAEASERCAEAFADPAALVLLLEVLRVASTTTWETLLHPTAQYYRADDADGSGAVASETVLAMRVYKRREACLLAALAVSAAELLLLLSPDSPSLARVFTGTATGAAAAAAAASSPSSASASSHTTMTAEQQAFLNTALDAVDLRAWLAEKPTIEAQLHEPMSDAVPPAFLGASPLTVVGLERERVLYNLLRATLAVQGVLLHIAPDAANLQRVLPLLTDTLHKASLPMHVWCGVLPLLMDTCEYLNGRADDVVEVRAAATALTTHRLRATQAAVRLLHVLVDAVGETNDSDKHGDDEAAFAANPLGALLQSGSLFYAFGLLLKDVLWMSPTAGDASASNGAAGDASPVASGAGAGTHASSSSGSGDVMTRQAQQRALRAESAANATATEVQMVLLSTEVHVWEVASTLLLMLPVVSLGDPSLTWRALVQAVQSRYELHLEAAAAAADSNSSDTAAVNIVQHSARTHQLLWMQLESLGQMLWTMQRKQSKASSGGGGGGALAAFNHVLATAADVDLLVRVAWESAASTVLKQSCVGTVGLLCTSMQSPDAVATAARFALALIANGSGSAAAAALAFGKTLLEVYAQVLPSATVPTAPAARRVWMQQLRCVDATATVRCEAANTLVDLFLDERFDAAVYWPLRVQDGLAAFKAQLALFVKRRRQLDKETRKHYHVSTETPEAEQWAEVLENLDGFLDYKASHK